MRAAAERLAEADPVVLEVRLFGSLARDEAVPGSDADVLIVLDHHPAARWFDRIPQYAQAFTDTDMPVEVFPYTRAELAVMESEGSGLTRAARAGLLLAARGAESGN